MIKEMLAEPHYDENELHLSRLAKCGKKYAYERMRNVFSSHKDIFDIGLAWEHYLTTILEKNNPPGTVINNLEVSADIDGLHLVGHVDISVAANDNENAKIFEVKYSESPNDYWDSYVRQIRAYGAALLLKGITAELWIEIYKRKNWREYHLKKPNDDDIKSLELQVKAFKTKRYQRGIESSMCKICPLFQFCNAESMEDYGEPIWLL
jgi:CRISPR/Cas system-associated exonuclease Cas4 (RecB family)